MSVWLLKYAYTASYPAHAPLNRVNGGHLPDTYLHIVIKNKRSYISDCWLPGTFSFPAISGGQWPPLLLQVIYYQKYFDWRSSGWLESWEGEGLLFLTSSHTLQTITQQDTVTHCLLFILQYKKYRKKKKRSIND